MSGNKDSSKTVGSLGRVSGCSTLLALQKESVECNRSDQVLLARIRSGHHWHFESYHKLVDDTHDTTCKECGWQLQDLEHWFCHCPATAHIRMRVFDTHVTRLDIF